MGGRASKALARIAVIVLAVLGLGIAAAPARSAAPLVFTMPIAYGTYLPGLGAPARDFARLVRDLSGGGLVFDVKQPGESVLPQDILAAVSSGKVGAGFAKSSFWAGRLPAAPLFSGYPFGPDAETYAQWFYAGDGLKLYQQMYDQAHLNVKVLPCAFGGAETAGWFAKEIKSPSDIKGLRMRIFGLGGLVMARAGAVQPLIEGGQIARAFAQGKLDAAELYPPADDAPIHLDHTVKRIYLPGWHQPATVMELLINKDRWNALDDRQQLIVATACRSMMLQTLTENPVREQAALAGFAKHGVRIERLPESVLSDLHQQWNKVAAQQGQDDAFFQEVLENIRHFRSQMASDRHAMAIDSGTQASSTGVTSSTR